MAEINTTIYPTEGEETNIIKWSKALLGANFPDYIANGLEKSITFSSSAHPNAPFNNLCTAWSEDNTRSTTVQAVARYTSGYNNQRIFLTKSLSKTETGRFYPSDNSAGRGTRLMYEEPWGVAFDNNKHQIVTGLEWRGLCGRMLVYYSVTPAGDPLTESGAHQVGGETYVTTWKNFKEYAPTLLSGGITIFVWGVYIEDIHAGAPSGNRQYAITPVPLTPVVATLFENLQTGTEFAGYWYGAYRGSQSKTPQTPMITNINGVAVSITGVQNHTNFLPVFGGYAATGAICGGVTSGATQASLENSGGFLYVGAIQGEAPQHLFESYYQTTVHNFAAVAMAVTSSNFAAFTLAMEERAATYGIIICTNALNVQAVQQKNLTSLANATDVIIPLIDENGLYSGFTEDGEEAVENPPTAAVIAGGVDGVFTYGVPVDDPDVDPNHYVDSIDLSSPNLTALDAFNRTFAINKNGLDAFANFLWNANDTKFQEIVDGLKLFGENPIEGVINMILFPFDVAAKAGGSLQEIKIGRTMTGVEGYRLSERAPAVIELGSAEFRAAFKDTAPFLDYEPYTQAELYIPFIGKIPISTAQFVGHTVSVKMIVDYLTGACVAVVYCDQIPVIYKQGVIGVQIPITATNSAQFAQTMIGGIIGTAKDIGNTAAKAFSGDIGGALMSGAETAFNAYQTAATPVMYEGAGASSPSCAIFQPLKPYFVMYRPVPKEVNIYGHAVGYATQKTVIVGQCSGFSVFGNVDVTGIGATAEEKAAIKSLLEGGIYI